MPKRDGTGPIGMGSMTGRGAGFCANRMSNQDLKKSFVGFGNQRGCRRGFDSIGLSGCVRNDYNQTMPKADNKTYLENQKSRLEMQLSAVQEQLSDLNSVDE